MTSGARSFINAKSLRRDLAKILRRAAKGERITVLYRSRPLCEIVPFGGDPPANGNVEDDSLFGAGPVGRSRDRRTAAEHDAILYGKRRR